MLETILALLALAVILATLWSIGRRRRTYDQTWTIPTFTDSMPRERVMEAARIAQLTADAKLILHYRYRGRAASRREMERLITQRRWAQATRLLRDLHIYSAENVPIVSERRAMRRLRRWQDRETGRVGHSPTYIASH